MLLYLQTTDGTSHHHTLIISSSCSHERIRASNETRTCSSVFSRRRQCWSSSPTSSSSPRMLLGSDGDLCPPEAVHHLLGLCHVQKRTIPAARSCQVEVLYLLSLFHAPPELQVPWKLYGKSEVLKSEPKWKQDSPHRERLQTGRSPSCTFKGLSDRKSADTLTAAHQRRPWCVNNQLFKPLGSVFSVDILLLFVASSYLHLSVVKARETLFYR